MKIEKRVLHLKTTFERLTCERCGESIFGASLLSYTTSDDVYEDPPDGFVRCDKDQK